MTARQKLRPGVVLLAPDGEGERWTVLEVDVDLFEAMHISPGADGRSVEAGSFSTLGGALGAAYDILTLITEGRCPPMDEHIQQTVRDFVSALQDKGYDTETALKILQEIVERAATRPSKSEDSSTLFARSNAALA